MTVQSGARRSTSARGAHGRGVAAAELRGGRPVVEEPDRRVVADEIDIETKPSQLAARGAVQTRFVPAARGDAAAGRDGRPGRAHGGGEGEGRCGRRASVRARGPRRHRLRRGAHEAGCEDGGIHRPRPRPPGRPGAVRVEPLRERRGQDGARGGGGDRAHVPRGSGGTGRRDAGGPDDGAVRPAEPRRPRRLPQRLPGPP